MRLPKHAATGAFPKVNRISQPPNPPLGSFLRIDLLPMPDGQDGFTDGRMAVASVLKSGPGSFRS